MAEIVLSSGGRRISRRSKVLIGLLAALLLALPVSRLLLVPSRPLPPPAHATEAQLQNYYLARLTRDPADREAYLELGKLDERSGYYMQALDRLRAARVLGAPDIVTAGLIGRCCVRLARYEEAKVELEKAARLKPDSVTAAIDLATFFSEGENDRGAAQVLQYFLRHHPILLERPTPAQRDDLERLMTAFTLVGDRDTALRLAKHVMELAPNEPNGYAVAGRNLLEQKQYPEAAQYLRQAVRFAPKVGQLHFLLATALAHLPGTEEETLKEWQATVDFNPNAVYAYLQLGQAYARRKDWRRAGTAYMLAGDLKEADPKPYSQAAQMWEKLSFDPGVRYCRGKAAAVSRQHAVALQEFLALSKNPDAVWRKQGLSSAADAYHALKRDAEYLALLRKLAEGGTAEDWVRLGDAYAELHRYRDRVACLKKALAKDPQFAGHVHHQLGTIAEAGGLRDEAAKEYELAVAASPNVAQYHRALTKLYLDMRGSDALLKRAVQEAQHAVRLSHADAEDLIRLGLAYKSAGDIAQAQQVFQHTLDLQPGYGPAYLELSRIYRQLGNKARAEEMTQRFRRYEEFDLRKRDLKSRALANRKDPANWEALGDFFAEARDLKNAAQFYARAVSLAPHSAGYRTKLQRTLGRTAASTGVLAASAEEALSQ